MEGGSDACMIIQKKRDKKKGVVKLDFSRWSKGIRREDYLRL